MPFGRKLWRNLFYGIDLLLPECIAHKMALTEVKSCRLMSCKMDWNISTSSCPSRSSQPVVSTQTRSSRLKILNGFQRKSPVWLDVGLKSNPNLPKIVQQVATAILLLKLIFLQLPQKSPDIWITFARKYVTKSFQKSPNLVTLRTTLVWLICALPILNTSLPLGQIWALIYFYWKSFMAQRIRKLWSIHILNDNQTFNVFTHFSYPGIE